MARQRQRMGVENQLSATLSRKDLIHLNGVESPSAGKHPFESRTQRGKFKEHRVERPIAGLDSLVSAEHDQRIRNGVEDRLGAFTLVDDLIDACAESGHIRERKHGAANLALTIFVARYAGNEKPVPVEKIGPRL